jgi:tRNA (guanine37-N1)-methyltransferase
VKPKRPRDKTAPMPEPKRVPVPPTISHFVMNLPGLATTFLHHYIGLYSGMEELFTPHTSTHLPLIHVHCFSFKDPDPTLAQEDICQRIYDEIGVRLTPGSYQNDGEVYIHEVRNISPTRNMFCASFRLPVEVAFAPRQS